MGVRRITISLPNDLFERGERERRKSHERRSEFVARLYRRYLDEIAERERIARYTAAYAKDPETPAERWLTDRSTALLSADEDA